MPHQTHSSLPSAKPPRVLIFAENPAILERLASAVSTDANVCSVDRATDLSQLEDVFASRKPDVAMMVLSPHSKEFQIVRAVKASDSSSTLIILSNFPSVIYHKKWIEAGADFYFDTARVIDILPDLLSWKTRGFNNKALAFLEQETTNESCR